MCRDLSQSQTVSQKENAKEKKTKRIATSGERKVEKQTTLMADVLEKMTKRGDDLVRWTGGWWSYPDCPSRKKSYQGLPMPEWSAREVTVHGLIKRGEVVVIQRDEFTGRPVRVTLKKAKE